MHSFRDHGLGLQSFWVQGLITALRFRGVDIMYGFRIYLPCRVWYMLSLSCELGLGSLDIYIGFCRAEGCNVWCFSLRPWLECGLLSPEQAYLALPCRSTKIFLAT